MKKSISYVPLVKEGKFSNQKEAEWKNILKKLEEMF